MNLHEPQASLKEIGQDVQTIADSMTRVALNIALLGVEGDADEQMKIITDENNKVLDIVRRLYKLPSVSER